MGSRTRAALYHRVSTVDQNPHAARQELRAAARRLSAARPNPTMGDAQVECRIASACRAVRPQGRTAAPRQSSAVGRLPSGPSSRSSRRCYATIMSSKAPNYSKYNDRPKALADLLALEQAGTAKKCGALTHCEPEVDQRVAA